MKKILLFLMVVITLSCENNSYSDLIAIPESNIILKWNKAYPDDSIDKSIIGLKWAISYLGASLPSNEVGISYTNNSISLDIKKLGFDLRTIEKLTFLNAKIVTSEEYQKTNAVDLGRYVALLLGASEQYCEIIGTPKRLNDLLANYTLKPEKGYLNNSAVSLEHRIKAIN
jgi:hypothetical protein